MNIIIKAIPIYNFLNYCNSSPLSKNVLDLGAGGKVPLLYIFNECGYKTYGIDFSDKADDDKIIHSYFDDEECEKYFEGFEVIFKEKRITEKYIECKKYKLSYIDYILKKL